MSLYTQHMIDNCAVLVPFSKTHALQMPVPACAKLANSWHKKMWPSSTKLCGLHWEADKLMEVSQNHEAWRALIHKHPSGDTEVKTLVWLNEQSCVFDA